MGRGDGPTGYPRAKGLSRGESGDVFHLAEVILSISRGLTFQLAGACVYRGPP